MDDLNEEADNSELCCDKRDQGDEEDDDVDIYQDLQEEITIKESDANSNVIERFNKLCSPRKRTCANFSAEEASDEDIDLYGDLNTFENQLVAEELQAKVECLEQKCSNLDSQNTELKNELDKVNKLNLALRRNISSIFKTAKAELERKDRQLKELQRAHDVLIFRRGGGNNQVLPTVNNNLSTDPPIPTGNITTPSSSKSSMLNPDYMANPSQSTSTPRCLVLKKDQTKGNIVTIENETECTFQMGKVTVSFTMESADFKKRRLQRLARASSGKASSKEDLKNANQNINGEQPPQQEDSNQGLPKLLAERATLLDELASADENLEEGEFTEETKDEKNPKLNKGRETYRRKDNCAPRRRSRSSSRSRSPVNNKRKRSSSNERHFLRNTRPNERGPPKRMIKPRSPAKNSRYRNTGNSHFSSRSNRR
ncbi:uncharacterized protein LOC130696462 [Daphnia carinata]|uniref:uncharacterized protein LOC130696462 n=1 Tax=Daphnia carinata TaxID=120202 RepID=UPI00257CD1F6|nr:uncharacterized protein LOC130696462 [Daphnia carinata]